MAEGNILIVDDNPDIVNTLEILLKPEFSAVHGITNPNLIHSELEKTNYNLVILDMNFKTGLNNGNEGIFWLNEIKSKHPHISVVLITAYSEVELAVKALKEGAEDFISKPWDNHKLLATIKSAIKLNKSRKEVNELKQKEKSLKNEINQDRKFIIGNSTQLMQVLNLCQKVAKTNANILITGENGTGKELIAREIHRLSKRNKEVLVRVDMGAISESLFESELFGHIKGSFTDARENRPGKFETANNGTLFLDEIGNLSFNLQAKLLTAIQSKEIMRVGSDKTIPVDIRLVCATNKNLELMVEEGLFREDLLYRINTIHIEVPALRNRKDDIPILADFFLKKFAHKYEKGNLKLNASAINKLVQYKWPGNIRELQHTIEKAVILSDSGILKPDDFFFKSINQISIDDKMHTLAEMEQNLILKTIKNFDGNMSLTAEKLGITRQTLYNKMKKYDL